MKSQAAAQHWCGPCLCSELLSLLTAVQRDLIWEQGRMDELADLELPSAFSIHTGCFVSPKEVTSHVTGEQLRSNTSTCHQTGWRATVTARNYTCSSNTAPPMIPKQNCSLSLHAVHTALTYLLLPIEWRHRSRKTMSWQSEVILLCKISESTYFINQIGENCRNRAPAAFSTGRNK